MTKLKHTPGPWYAAGAWVEHPDDDVADICTCDPASMGQSHLGRDYEEVIANARLIAAAPEMLHALKEVARDPNFERLSQEAIELVFWAIGDATGGSE